MPPAGIPRNSSQRSPKQDGSRRRSPPITEAFPIADSYIEIEAANLMRFRATALFDAAQPCGAEANTIKLLAAKASWEAANVRLQRMAGLASPFEFDVERKFRQTRLYQVAPISTNLIYSYIAEHVPGLPRSF